MQRGWPCVQSVTQREVTQGKGFGQTNFRLTRKETEEGLGVRENQREIETVQEGFMKIYGFEALGRAQAFTTDLDERRKY